MKKIGLGTKNGNKQAWFDYNTWGRAKVDMALYEEGVSKQARVIDFKTGKFRKY